MAAVAACAGGIVYALTRQNSQNNAHSGGIAAAAGVRGGWDLFGRGGGGGGNRGVHGRGGGGFELTDFGRERKTGEDGFDEFLVARGDRGEAASGPGYANLLSDQ